MAEAHRQQAARPPRGLRSGIGTAFFLNSHIAGVEADEEVDAVEDVEPDVEQHAMDHGRVAGCAPKRVV